METHTKTPQLTNLALTELIKEIQHIENAFVNNIQTLDNEWIKMKVHTKKGDKNLIFTPNSFFISDRSIPAKQNPGGFSALLKKYLFNQRIVSIKQNGADRIVIFEFPNNFMIIELFAKGNIILCEKDFKIIKAMRKEEWKDRKLDKDSIYKFPSSKGINPLEENEEDFYKKIKENQKTIFGATVDTLNVLPAVLEKTFLNLKIDKKKNANELTKKETTSILQEVKKIINHSEKNIYLSSDAIYAGDLNIPKEKEFDSVNSALNILMTLSSNNITNKVEEKKKIKDTSQTRINSINAQIKGLEIQEKELKEKGDLIYLKYNEITEVVNAINKGKQKGLTEKEIAEKINSVKPIITVLDLKKSTVKLKL